MNQTVFLFNALHFTGLCLGCQENKKVATTLPYSHTPKLLNSGIPNGPQSQKMKNLVSM
jgi:hypothetical protein